MPMTVTRGYGLFEHMLARKRARKALELIGDGLEEGRILDIGCGLTPYFLQQVPCGEKTGLDQTVTPERKAYWKERGIELVARDLDREPAFPFADNSFDVVTMLAVFEHIEAENLRKTVREILRVLKPGGIYVLTTPASWTDPLIATLSWFGFLSSDEIDEHEETHTHASIKKILIEAGFDAQKIECGTFECGMNLWARAKK